jgi:hypothetical protein
LLLLLLLLWQLAVDSFVAAPVVVVSDILGSGYSNEM